MQQELRIREPCMAGGLAKSCFVTEFIRVPARIPAQPRVACRKITLAPAIMIGLHLALQSLRCLHRFISWISCWP